MARAAALQHTAPLHWHARSAPIHSSGSGCSWRERAARHRQELGAIVMKSNGLHHQLAEAHIPDGRSCRGLVDSASPKPSSHQERVDLLADATAGSDAAMLLGEISISATDLVAADDLVIPEDEDTDIRDGYSEDWWGIAMRVDLEKYIAYKNVQLRHSAQANASVSTIFENAAVWSVLSEIMCWERQVLRRRTRGQLWPDTMLPPATMSRDQVEELQGNIARWTQALEDLDDINNIRANLRSVPVDFILQQLLADAFVAAGETHEARWALLLVVGAASPEKEPEKAVGKAQFAPPRVGWDDRCFCDYAKAQQCIRFGRLAVITAQSLSSPSDSREASKDSTQHVKETQRLNALSQEIASGQRHLTDARRLFKAELSALLRFDAEHNSGFDGACLWGPRDVNNFRIVLRCGLLGATALLASIYSLGGRIAEARGAYDETIQESSDLLKEKAGTARLQRLLAAEREKAIEERCRLANA